jgi:hypothetical protein
MLWGKSIRTLQRRDNVSGSIDLCDYIDVAAVPSPEWTITTIVPGSTVVNQMPDFAETMVDNA